MRPIGVLRPEELVGVVSLYSSNKALIFVVGDSASFFQTYGVQKGVVFIQPLRLSHGLIQYIGRME